MPFVQANGISIYYEIGGSGNPVLFISGTGADLRVKPNVLDGPLAKQKRVLAFDQRGLGQTEKPRTQYEMEDYADDAAALLVALNWQKVDVIGVSFGGMVALHLALRHAHLINRLVLCCTSPGGEFGSYPFHELPSNLSPLERIVQLMPVNDTRRDAAWQKRNPEFVERAIQYAKDHEVAEHSSPEYQESAKRQVDARSRHDVVARLGDISHETLICAGKYDGIAPAENQEVLHKGIKHAQMRWFEGGHLFLNQDKSAIQEILSFLSST